MFKQLIKLLLTEVYLFKFNGHILTSSELKVYFKYYSLEQANSNSISELIESGEIEKVKYQCIKVTESCDINYFSLSSLNLYLIDVNKLRNFEESYDTLIEKSLGCFWDYDQEELNKKFMENLENIKKNIKIN